jgi:phage antirepressor YoqD-like protein
MSQRINEIQSANIVINKWLEMLKSGYKTNNKSEINIFEQNLSNLPIKVYPENLYRLANELTKITEQYPQNVKHIYKLIFIVEQLNGQLRAREQMQMRDENIEPKAFAKQLLFQFEPKLYVSHSSAEVNKASRDWLFNQAYPEKNNADAVRLMNCFASGADDSKIKRYVDFITSATIKNDARFAAEVLLQIMYQDDSLRAQMTDKDVEKIIAATESSAWKKAVKKASHSMTNLKSSSDKEETIQKIYREIMQGNMPDLSKPREAIRPLLNVLHQNMVYDDTILNEAITSSNTQETSVSSNSGEIVTQKTTQPVDTMAINDRPNTPRQDGGVVSARPKLPFFDDIKSASKISEKAQEAAPSKTSGDVEGARPKPPFLNDIKSASKILEKAQEAVPSKTSGDVEGARPKPPFLNDIKSASKILEKAQEAAPSKTSGVIEGARPKLPFFDDIKSASKILEKAQEAAPSKTSGVIEGARPKLSFTDEIESGHKKLKKVQEAAPSKTGGVVEGARPKLSFTDEIVSGHKKLKKAQEATPSKTGGNEVQKNRAGANLFEKGFNELQKKLDARLKALNMNNDSDSDNDNGFSDPDSPKKK